MKYKAPQVEAISFITSFNRDRGRPPPPPPRAVQKVDLTIAPQSLKNAPLIGDLTASRSQNKSCLECLGEHSWQNRVLRNLSYCYRLLLKINRPRNTKDGITFRLNCYTIKPVKPKNCCTFECDRFDSVTVFTVAAPWEGGGGKGAMAPSHGL